MIQIETYEDYTNAINKYTVVIIDHYTSWCGPCKAIKPKIEALSRKYPLAAFCQVNIETVNIKDITSIPTFHFYHDSKLVDTVVGADVNAVETKVASILKSIILI